MSRGAAQVWPSSVLEVTQTVRVPLLLLAVMSASLSLPRLCVISSQMVSVKRSTTGQGLPQVLSASSQTTDCFDQVLPPSVERFSHQVDVAGVAGAVAATLGQGEDGAVFVTNSDGMR